MSVGGRTGGQREPNCQADEGIAKDAERDRLGEAELDLRMRDRESRDTERAISAAVGASEIDERRRAAGSHEVPDEDDEPVPAGARTWPRAGSPTP